MSKPAFLNITKEAYDYCLEFKVMEELLDLVKSLKDFFITIKLPQIKLDNFLIGNKSKKYLVISLEVIGSKEEVEKCLDKYTKLKSVVHTDSFALDLVAIPPKVPYYEEYKVIDYVELPNKEN